MHDEDFQDGGALMEEPPGGTNNGRRRRTLPSSDDAVSSAPWEALDVKDSYVRDLLWTEGYSITGPGHGGTKGNPGGRDIHPDEYVDEEFLRELVLEEFGFTSDELGRAYTQATAAATDGDRDLRARLDARMLELYREGAHIGHFAKAVGLSRSTIDRAVRRATEAEAAQGVDKA